MPRAKRWLTIQGKDPSEARQNGLDLRAWVMAGLLLLPASESEVATRGNQESTESTSDDHRDVRQLADNADQGEPTAMVKCCCCAHLDGYRCTRGHRPDGIALLRECDDFSFSRKEQAA